MIKYEEKQVVRSVPIGYICDQCEKEIKADRFPKDWIRFQAGTSSWPEGIDTYEICSVECYSIFLEDFIDSYKNTSNVEFNEMELEFAKKLNEVLMRGLG